MHDPTSYLWPFPFKFCKIMAVAKTSSLSEALAQPKVVQFLCFQLLCLRKIWNFHLNVLLAFYGMARRILNGGSGSLAFSERRKHSTLWDETYLDLFVHERTSMLGATTTVNQRVEVFCHCLFIFPFCQQNFAIGWWLVLSNRAPMTNFVRKFCVRMEASHWFVYVPKDCTV